MSVVIFALGIKSTNGLVKSTINTANAFVKNHIDTAIINTVGQHGGLDFLDPAFPLDKRVKKYTLDTLYLHKKNRISLKQQPFFSIKQRFLKVEYTKYHEEVLKEIDENLTKDDLIIFTHPLLMQIYMMAAPNSSAKKLIQVHGNYIEEKDNFKLLEGYYDKIDYVQSVSRYMNRDMVEKLGSPPEKTTYIPNICTPINIVKNKQKFIKKISIVGSIQDRKNQLDAVKMMTFIEDKNIILQIIGNSLDKKYEKNIQDYIKRKGLEHRVHFLGIKSERDIYENSDILILPSKHEGFGYTFLECSLYKIPTVAYEFDYGSKEFLDHISEHCLVKQGDFRGLAAKVSLILEDKHLYNTIVKENHRKFKAEFSEEIIINKYIELLGDRGKKLLLKNLEFPHNKALSFTHINMKSSSLSYRISMDIEGGLNNFTLYYLYKSIKYPIENLTSKHSNLISFKINKLSTSRFLNILRGFYLIAEDSNEQEHYIGFISKKKNYEMIYHNQSYYPEYVGSVSIKKIRTWMDKSGLFIRYPSPEAILSVCNEGGESLKYQTKLINNNGEYQPYFHIMGGMYKELTVLMNTGKKAVISFDDISFSGLFHRLSTLEANFNLYDIKVANIYAWELIRVEIFENILVETGVLDIHFTKQIWNKPYIHTKSKSLFNIPSNSTIIFEFPRKKDLDYKTSHIHTTVDTPAIIEYPQTDGYTESIYNPAKNIYPIEEYNKFRNPKKLVYSLKDRQEITKMSEVISKEIGLTINLFPFIDGRLKKFKREYTFFNKLFKKVTPKEVIIPSSYWSAGIIAAAKEHNAITSDIQYALLSSRHPSYAFPAKKRHYGADRIYIWSDYWNTKVVPYKEYVVTPRNYFLDRCKDLGISAVMAKKHDIAFVSQSRIGSQLLDIAFETANNDQELSIVYCPHPDEDISSYTQHVAFSKLPNTSISTEDTLKSVSTSDHVVGVYSTTMIEALALGKKVYLATLSGHGVLHKEIEAGYLTTFDSAKELIHKISNANDENDIDFCKLFYGTSVENINT